MKNLFSKPSYLWLICVPLLFLLVSCEIYGDPKMDHTEVRGVLRDAATGEPIEGGTVYLMLGLSSIKKDSFTTGVDGRYHFSYDHETNLAANVWAKAPSYLSNENAGNWGMGYPNGGATGRDIVAENGEVNYIDIRLPPKGYVQYHFRQVEPYSGTMDVRFIPYDTMGVVAWNGQGLNRTYTSVYPGGVANRIGYSIIRDGELYKSVDDTLFIPRFDTLYYYVEF